MHSVAHLSREPRLYDCETCNRTIKAKDWAAHAASKKHREGKDKANKAAKQGAQDKKAVDDEWSGFPPVATDGFVNPSSDANSWADPGYVETSQPQGGGDGCFNCGETGHQKRDCPQRPSGYGGGGNGCYNCGDSSHMKKDCPTLRPDTCFKCGQAGHRKRDCPENGSGGFKCYNCGESGHAARDCEKEKSSTPGGRKCYGCGGYGHICANCPGEQGGTPAGGYNQSGWDTVDAGGNGDNSGWGNDEHGGDSGNGGNDEQGNWSGVDNGQDSLGTDW